MYQPLAQQIAAAVAHWHQCGEFTPQTLQRSSEVIDRFGRRLAAQGVLDLQEVTAKHCAEFITARTAEAASPGESTQHFRRTVVRMAFRALRAEGEPLGDPTLDVHLPPRSGRRARPLTDEEIALCRATTRLEPGRLGLRRSVVWALAEATAVTSEIPTLRVQDLDDARQPHWVALPGTRRHDARRAELTDWGRSMLARYLDTIDIRADAPLLYSGRQGSASVSAQASICNAVGEVLNAAGVSAEDVRPASVRNWAGRRLFDAGIPLHEVAQRMGMRSLDATAEDIDLEWR
jgi:site-specific recombinase XerD